MKAKLLFMLMFSLFVTTTAWAEISPPADLIVPSESLTGSYQVKWTGVSVKGVSYQVQEAMDGGSFADLPLVKTTKISLRGRLAGHTYRYQVRAQYPDTSFSEWVTTANDCYVPHVVSIKSNAGGVMSVGSNIVSGSIKIPVGETPELIITPHKGFHVVSLVVDGVSLLTDTKQVWPYSCGHETPFKVDLPKQLVDNQKNKHVVSVKFSIDKVRVFASSSTGGTVSPVGEKIYKFGSLAKYRVKEEFGNNIVGVYYNGMLRNDLYNASSKTISFNVTEESFLLIKYEPEKTKRYIGGEILEYDIFYKSNYSNYFQETEMKQGAAVKYITYGYVMPETSETVYKVIEFGQREDGSTYEDVSYCYYGGDNDFINVNGSIEVPGNPQVGDSYAFYSTIDLGGIQFTGDLYYDTVDRGVVSINGKKTSYFEIKYYGKLYNKDHGVIISLPNSLNEYVNIHGTLYVSPRIGILGNEVTYVTGSHNSDYITYYMFYDLSDLNF